MQRLSLRHVAAVLAALVLVVFARSLQNGFVWDDWSLLPHNAQFFDRPTAWRDAFTHDYWHVAMHEGANDSADHRLYRPLLKLVQTAEFRLWRDQPFGYHAVNLLLHMLCALLVLRWLHRRIGAKEPHALVAASLGALVFALHPSRAESVAWIAGASDLWAALWVLLALEAWDRGTKAGVALSALSLATALFFKESAIGAALAIGCDALLLSTDAPARRRQLARFAPLLATVVAGLAVRLAMAPVGGAKADSLAEVGKRVLATAGQFVHVALWPVPLSTQIAINGDLDASPWPARFTLVVVLGALATLAFLALLITAIRRPALRPVLADVLWSVCLAGPMLNVVPVGGLFYMGERYLYLPMLGIAALSARFGAWAIAGTVRRRLVLVPVGVALLAGTVLAFGHVADFESDRSLWTAEYERDPYNTLVTEALMKALWLDRQLDAAAQMADARWKLPLEDDARAATWAVWLAIEIDRAKADDAALEALRVTAETAANQGASAPVQHPLARRFERLSPAARKTLAASTDLQVARAWLALRTHDAEAAEKLFAPLLSDSTRQQAMWQPLALALALQGRTDEARKLLDQAQAAGAVIAVEELRMALDRNHVTSGQDDEARDAQRVLICLGFGQKEIARSMAVRAQAKAPESVAVALARFHVEVESDHFTDARTQVDLLTRLLPEQAARWQGSREQVDQAEVEHARLLPP